MHAFRHEQAVEPGPAGAGVVIDNSQGGPVFEAGFFLGRMTNNMAEYEALVRALRKITESSVREVCIYTDSLLVANQMAGRYKVLNDTLRQYVIEAKDLAKGFAGLKIKHIPREKNRLADSLAKKGASKKG